MHLTVKTGEQVMSESKPLFSRRELFYREREEIANRRKIHVEKVITEIYEELGKEEPAKDSWLKNDV